MLKKSPTIIVDFYICIYFFKFYFVLMLYYVTKINTCYIFMIKKKDRLSQPSRILKFKSGSVGKALIKLII